MSNEITKEINSFKKKKRYLILNSFLYKKDLILHNYKDNQKTINRYNVIYKIKCNCEKSSIGKTKRNLAARIFYFKNIQT